VKSTDTIRPQPVTMGTPVGRILARLALLLLGGTAVLAASGAMYRWVDENGVTVYSEQAPPVEGAVEIDKHAGPSEAEQQAAMERLRRQREQAFDEQEARQDAAAEKAEKAADAKQRAESCSAARSNLQKYQDLGYGMVKTPDGRYQLLSEEEVKVKLDLAQEQIKAFCD